MTTAPAQTGLQPITVLHGSLDEVARRMVYQDGHVGQLVKRAAAARRRADDPIVVVDPPPKVEQVGPMPGSSTASWSRGPAGRTVG